MSELDCIKEQVCDLGDGLDSLQDKVEGLTRTVYRMTPAVAGIINREWYDTKPAISIALSTTAAGRDFRLCHDFSLPMSTNTIVQDLALNDTNNTAGVMDIQVLDTYITVPAGGIWIQYTGGSEGYWAIEVGECCGPLQLQDELGYQDRLDNSQIVGPVFLPEGQHAFRAWNIDSGGTNSSHTDQYSTDGTTFSNAVPAGVEFATEKRSIECQEIALCEPAPEGWSICPPEVCTPGMIDPAPAESGGLSEDEIIALIGPHTVDTFASPQTVLANLESDNNESEGSWNRAGSVGTSLLYAREDHQHPIVRIPNPGDPVVVASGTFVETQNLILDRGSDEESYWYRYRVRVSQVAGANWGWIQVPTIAGFQQPIFSEVGGYMNGSVSVQDDDGVFGATARGPLMDYPIHHWSSTNRLYGGLFRRDNDITSLFVNFVVRYTRT